MAKKCVSPIYPDVHELLLAMTYDEGEIDIYVNNLVVNARHYIQSTRSHGA